jgi:hypothetical protein
VLHLLLLYKRLLSKCEITIVRFSKEGVNFIVVLVVRESIGGHNIDSVSGTCVHLYERVKGA